MTAFAALALVDRGELDLDANVATFWPEFAPHGKALEEMVEFKPPPDDVGRWHLAGHEGTTEKLGSARR